MLRIFIYSLLCIPNLCFAQKIDTINSYVYRYDDTYIEFFPDSISVIRKQNNINSDYYVVLMEKINGYILVFNNGLLVKEGGIQIDMTNEKYVIEPLYNFDGEIIQYEKIYVAQVKNTGIWLEHNGQSTAIKTYFEGNIISEKNIKLKNYPRKMEDYEVLFKNIGVR